MGFNDFTTLLQILKEAQARTVSGAFDQLLDKEINIARGIRTSASDSQNHLREFLATECKRDATFPRVLSLADNDFIGGSFARHTKRWPLDDIDIYMPLDGYNLAYYDGNGDTLPYTILSDGVLSENPLLKDRWMNAPYISSAKLIKEFASVLRRHYPEETEVRAGGEAVCVRMSIGATKSGDGLGYDVVPCFSLRPYDPDEHPFYLMPDGKNGWIRTNPRIDTEISKHIHTNNHKIYRKVVKLIKYWNAARLSGAIGSYYIELAIARAFLRRNNASEYIDSIGHGLTLGFYGLSSAVSQGDQQAWIAGSPPVERGKLTPAQYLQVLGVVGQAQAAWSYEQAGHQSDALLAWGEIFGDDFPKPL